MESSFPNITDAVESPSPPIQTETQESGTNSTKSELSKTKEAESGPSRRSGFFQSQGNIESSIASTEVAMTEPYEEPKKVLC